MDEEDAIQQSNQKITPLVPRQFIKRYGDVLKLIVSLNKSSIHTDIVGQIEDLIDDTNDETAIQRVLKRNRHQFVVLFNDDYFEKTSEKSDKDDDEDNDSEED